jgi:hypothetical protein
MKKLFFILFLLPFAAFAQTPQTSYVVPTISAMKSYYGAANRIYVVDHNADYIQCTTCSADEINVFVGAGGRKWTKISDSAKTNRSELQDSTNAIRHDFPTGGGSIDTTSLSNRIDSKVDKVTGKQLSTEDYSTSEKNKLATIAPGAEVNVNADWNAVSGDAQIFNKPTVPTDNNQLTNGAGYAKDNTVLHLTGNETSTGFKTFQYIVANQIWSKGPFTINDTLGNLLAEIAPNGYTDGKLDVVHKDASGVFHGGQLWAPQINGAQNVFVSYLPASLYRVLLSSVKINGSTHYADSSGTVDLGNISGGSGGVSNNADSLGGQPASYYASQTGLTGKADKTTTVNGHALSASVVVSASDLTTGTLPHAQLPALVSADIPNNTANTTGNAGTVTNGVYTTGAYVNPGWITSIPYSKITGGPTIPAQFNPIAGGNITLSGTYPNITFSAAASGTGTVTSFSKTDGFGIISTVTNPTTTPNFSASVDTGKVATLNALKSICFSGLPDSSGLVLNLPYGTKDTAYFPSSGSGGSGGSGGSVSYAKQTYTTGSSVLINNTTTWLVINPASLTDSISIQLPAVPTDGQKIEIVFGGQVTTGAVLNKLTILPNSSQAILGSSFFTNVVVGDRITFQYNSTNSNWYR